jgi:hypothetical protein
MNKNVFNYALCINQLQRPWNSLKLYKNFQIKVQMQILNWVFQRYLYMEIFFEVLNESWVASQLWSRRIGTSVSVIICTM